MKQVIVKKGKVFNEEVAPPIVEPGFLLIQVANSCISAGTEIASVNSTKKSMINRAMEKPEKISMVLQMLKQRGLLKTLRQIKDISGTGMFSGYSVSGKVIETGQDITDIKPGDRVAAAGGGYAIHAEFVLVPQNLVVKIPDNVAYEEAASATIGAIALHGVRRAGLAIGEFAVVVGCGIIGLFTTQILIASGVKVAAIDLDKKRLELAKKFGAQLTICPADHDPVNIVRQWSEGMGADAVIFTAAVKEKDPLSQSFKMCRRKGRVVLVGTTPIEIDRQDIYTDEIDFLISTSYGPGRYDKNYEEGGNDYPYAYVRWTEQRNIKEFLALVGNKSVDIQSMIDETFPIEESEKAFASLSSGTVKPLIVLLDYKLEEDIKNQAASAIQIKNENKNIKGQINVAIVGTGNFFKSVHLPNLQELEAKYNIYAVMSRKGYDAKIIAEQNRAEYSTTDFDKIISDPNVNLVFISTRHESHGSLTLKALRAGKHVFVEKPLAIRAEELKQIQEFYLSTEYPPLLMVGYNRRFSPISKEIKKAVNERVNPLFIRYRMNAGYLKKDHWVFNEGGRIVGEACHIIDLMQYLVESSISEVAVSELTPKTDYYSSGDNKSFTLKFEDGSIASIDYFSNGNSKLSKEYMEIHFDGKSIVMDDYKTLDGYGVKIKPFNSKLSNKGHLEELGELYNFLSGKSQNPPTNIEALLENSFVNMFIK